MDVRFWAATDTGRTRDHNEDNFLVDKKLNLFIVADGMGGHAAGEVASSVAVREVRRVIAERRELVETYAEQESSDARQALLRLIESAVQQACGRVYGMAQESAERRGMGTTLSLLLVVGRRGFIGHVGDSRIYLSRAHQVHQLTEDHSLINELIKRGRLKPGDAFDSPYKNAVTRAVGVYESVEVDTFDFDVLPSDDFLLCSDGLSCYIDDAITLDYLGADKVKEIPDRFIRLANESGGKDNITAVVVRIEVGEEDDQQLRMDEVRQKLDTLRAIPLFKYLSYKGLVKVMNVTDTRRFPPGHVVFEEGDRDDAFFILLDGQVRLTKEELELAVLEAGSHFGEMAMVDKAARSATATTVGEVKALVIQRAQFYELMRRDPVMSVKLMWSFIQVLNTRLRVTNRELLSARSTIDVLRRNQVGGVVAEMPSVDPAAVVVGALPVGVTDELMPGFLFAESESSGTDPLLRTDGPATGGDLDDRPGLELVEMPDDDDDVETAESRITLDQIEATRPLGMEAVRAGAAEREPSPPPKPIPAVPSPVDSRPTVTSTPPLAAVPEPELAAISAETEGAPAERPTPKPVDLDSESSSS